MGILVATVTSSRHQVDPVDLRRDDTAGTWPLLPWPPANGLRPFGFRTPLTGGEGLLIPPMRCDGEKIDKHTPGTYLRVALEQLGLARPGLGWYQATRHTFASQWVMAGGSIEKLNGIQALEPAPQAPETVKETPEPPCKPGSVPPEDRRRRTFL
jgi:hypothetical protein